MVRFCQCWQNQTIVLLTSTKRFNRLLFVVGSIGDKLSPVQLLKNFEQLNSSISKLNKGGFYVKSID